MNTFLERYKAGDRIAVWDELIALGDGVREERYYADASAVAAETMRRARHNVEVLIQRLEFSSLGMGQAAPIPEARTPDSGGDYAPDPLVIYPVEELLDQLSERKDDEEEGEVQLGEVELVISPDALQKANISGDACYITVPDARADFEFDDGRNNSFVNHLRVAFQWGGFPGWERLKNPPLKQIAELSDALLPL